MTGRGNFFAVDRTAWEAACGLESLNAAVAYLVLARGTLRDMRTTSWSVNAIEQHTGIARPRAARAIEALIASGLVEQTKGGKRPAYVLASFGSDPAWIWLPNSIVDGAGKETPPVERIRQTQSLPVLRLFVDLYAAQALAADGGVNWRTLRQVYDREQIGQRGPFVVWGFSPASLQTWERSAVVASFLTGSMVSREAADGSQRQSDTGMPAFWSALRTITDLRLLDFVPHLIEADSDEASVIHPLSYETGEPEERDLAAAACNAGFSMLNEAQQSAAADRFSGVAPILKHIAGVALVGLPRLRHRARTSATAEWRGRADEWKQWAARYRELEREVLSGQSLAISTGINGHQQ